MILNDLLGQTSNYEQKGKKGATNAIAKLNKRQLQNINYKNDVSGTPAFTPPECLNQQPGEPPYSGRVGYLSIHLLSIYFSFIYLSIYLSYLSIYLYTSFYLSIYFLLSIYILSFIYLYTFFYLSICLLTIYLPPEFLNQQPAEPPYSVWVGYLSDIWYQSISINFIFSIGITLRPFFHILNISIHIYIFYFS